MISVAVSYALPPLRCETCEGSGYVDNTEAYLRQWDYFWDGAGPPTAPCRVCSGTGRHVSRARAGLAAPLTYVYDIETGGLHPRSPAEAKQDSQDLADALALMRIVDDVQEDTSEARAKARSWFEAPIQSSFMDQIKVFHTAFRPGPYPDSLWDVSHAPKWWSEAAKVVAREPQTNFFEIENPPIFPDGIHDTITMSMLADLHRMGEAANIFILGDVESVEEDGVTTHVYIDGALVEEEPAMRVITEDEIKAARARLEAEGFRTLTDEEIAAYIEEIEAHPGGIVYIGPEDEETK